jgi:hypothetical protein
VSDLLVFGGIVAVMVVAGILVGMIVAGRIDRITAPGPVASGVRPAADDAANPEEEQA